MICRIMGISRKVPSKRMVKSKVRVSRTFIDLGQRLIQILSSLIFLIKRRVNKRYITNKCKGCLQVLKLKYLGRTKACIMLKRKVTCRLDRLV